MNTAESNHLEFLLAKIKKNAYEGYLIAKKEESSLKMKEFKQMEIKKKGIES